MNATHSCPIWGTPATVEDEFNRNVKWVNSIRAGGRYRITREAESSLPRLTPRHKARLTSWLVDQRKWGNENPEVYRDTLKVEGEKRKDLFIHVRADRLLQFIETETEEIGTEHSFTTQEAISTPAAAWSESVDGKEVMYLLEYLCEQGFMQRKDAPVAGYPKYVLTVEGYARLAELESTNVESSRGFVAMWFNDSTEEAWKEGIKPGIKDAGYDPIRIDKQEYNNKIDDKIIAEIRRSRFIVADFTQGEEGARGSVYYEAGFAHGLNIEVIFTCRKDILEHIHFDTRQYNYIGWETPEELRRRLTERISATIGDGPNKEEN